MRNYDRVFHCFFIGQNKNCFVDQTEKNVKRKCTNNKKLRRKIKNPIKIIVFT